MPPKKSAGFGLANPRGARKSAGNSRSMQEAAAAALGTAAGDEEQRSFLVEAADRALAGAGYRVGAAVEYNSATLGGWAAATVTKVWAGGTVDVQTDEMAWGRYRGTRCAENLAPLGAGAKVLRLAGSGDATTPLVPSAEPEEMYRKRMKSESHRACRSTAAQAIDAAAAAPDGGAAGVGFDLVRNGQPRRKTARNGRRHFQAPGARARPPEGAVRPAGRLVCRNRAAHAPARAIY